MTDNTVKVLDLQRMWLATGLVCAFVASVMLLFFRAVPPENKDLVTYMIGQLSGMATMALSFYFINKAGQDAADAKKTENTGRALDAITATGSQKAGPSGTPEDPVSVVDQPPAADENR